MKNWKQKYSLRYKGRGNSWIKISHKSAAKKIIENKLKTFLEKGRDTKNYTNWTNSAGFYWLRFYKVLGSLEKPIVQFEIRFNGSKLYHENNLINIPGNIANMFDLLGNTPHKLMLEMSEEERFKASSTKTIVKEKEEVKEKVTLKESSNIEEGKASSESYFRIPSTEDTVMFKLFLISERAIEE
jgi:hypothetical protein